MSFPATIDLELLKRLKKELTRFMMVYQFGMDELSTKIDILKQEFEYTHDYNPIEHVSGRIKSPESILQKIQRKQIPFSLDSIKENIRDIAGIRITCSFISNIYEVCSMLEKQNDLEIVEKKDYIKDPKPNGYQSLHLIVKVPVFMTDRVEDVFVEIQIRTIGMDFWASLEHKIYYKYKKDVPDRLSNDLKQAAQTVAMLDQKMESLHKEIREMEKEESHFDLNQLNVRTESFPLPKQLLESLSTEEPS